MALLATVRGPLSRVADSSAAVMTLSAIQFDLEAVDVVVVKVALLAGTLANDAGVNNISFEVALVAVVGKVMVDCSLIEKV